MRDLGNMVATVESAGNTQAIRFEPTLYASINNAGMGTPWATLRATIAAIHKCSSPTAAMIAAASWGKYQLLGENIYTLCRYQKPIGFFMNDELAQASAFYNFCDAHGFDYRNFNTSDDTALEQFARIYNGPGNVAAYTARLIKARDAVFA